MRQIKTFILIGLAGTLLAACATSFRSDVSSFHQLPRPSGETIAVVPMNSELEGSLEFAEYAAITLAALEAQGYRRAAPGSQPDLLARLEYDIDDGQVIVRSYGGYGGYGGYWRSYHGWWGYPYGFRHYNDIRSYTQYTRTLTLEIAESDNPEQNLFESTVVSEGRSRVLTEVMPLMIEALFTEFPGLSGVTRRVDIPLDQ